MVFSSVLDLNRDLMKRKVKRKKSEMDGNDGEGMKLAQFGVDQIQGGKYLLLRKSLNFHLPCCNSIIMHSNQWDLVILLGDFGTDPVWKSSSESVRGKESNHVQSEGSTLTRVG